MHESERAVYGRLATTCQPLVMVLRIIMLIRPLRGHELQQQKTYKDLNQPRHHLLSNPGIVTPEFIVGQLAHIRHS